MLLFGAAWVSALLLTWLFYAQAAAPRQEKMLRIVVASRDIPNVGTQLKRTDLKIANYPLKDAPKGIALKLDEVEGRVVLVPLSANEPVLKSKISLTTAVEGVSSTTPD